LVLGMGIFLWVILAPYKVYAQSVYSVYTVCLIA
jgi:hypothetical protein